MVDGQTEQCFLADINDEDTVEDLPTHCDIDKSVNDYKLDANFNEQMDPSISDLPWCSRTDSDLSQYDDDDDDGGIEPCSLRESICNWALKFGISLVALTALLSILQFYHPDLPKDARTILKTNSRYTIQKKIGGQYHYFGILSSIKIDSVSDCFTLKLQINIDGSHCSS